MWDCNAGKWHLTRHSHCSSEAQRFVSWTASVFYTLCFWFSNFFWDSFCKGGSQFYAILCFKNQLSMSWCFLVLFSICTCFIYVKFFVLEVCILLLTFRVLVFFPFVCKWLIMLAFLFSFFFLFWFSLFRLKLSWFISILWSCWLLVLVLAK